MTYRYDANSRVTGILSSIGNFGFAYDALGRRTSLTLPNGATTNYSYDNASRLLEMKHLNPLNAILEKISYVYDANGNRTSMDRLNVAPKLPNPANNITHNSANQLLTFNDKNITYDANGNMVTITNTCGTTTYTWNARNQLAGISGFDALCSPLSSAFRYDALGRRIEKTINGRSIQYVYDGLDIVQEIEDNTVTANYIRTMNIDEPLSRVKSDGTVRYYQQDALGSIIALTDETGIAKTTYMYDPFGNTTVSGEPSDNPFQYTGRENDGTGLYYYRARYYSPELQRFISEDPIGLAGGDVNLYSYVFNSPNNWIDPYGLFANYVFVPPAPKAMNFRGHAAININGTYYEITKREPDKYFQGYALTKDAFYAVYAKEGRIPQETPVGIPDENAAEAYAKSWIGKEWDYVYLKGESSNNCATFTDNVIRAGGGQQCGSPDPRICFRNHFYWNTPLRP